MGYSSCVAVVLLCSVTLFVSAQDCALPTDTEISNLLKPLLANSDGGSPSDYNPVIESVHYVCQAQGSIRDTYRAVSIISTFVPNGGPNPTGQRTNIFEFTCESGPVWDNNGQLATPPNGLINATTRTDCFACSPIFATDRCRACDSSCRDTCLGRCVGSGSACCATFTADGTCTTDTGCTSVGINYIATESTGCTCACNLTCTAGYSPNSNCTDCEFTDICARDMPCQNGGNCTLLSAPANYTCNCTDTGYEGVNCSDLIPSPSPSPSPQLPSPSPSPSPCTLSGCDECDNTNPGCCKTCLTSYSITDGCNCGIVTPSVTPTVCIVPGCVTCADNNINCCRVCSDGLEVNDCKCSSTMTSIMMSSPAVTETPTTPSRSDGGPGTLIGAILGAILGVLLLIVLAAVIVYLIYYFVAGAGKDSLNKAKSKSPFANGESHNNPLYLAPDEVAADEVAAL